MSARDRQAAQDYFLALLQTVMGQALDAAGYALERRLLQWAGGRYRFVKALEDGSSAQIEFQALVYSDNAWSMDQASRFQVRLGRSRRVGAGKNAADRFSMRSLSQLVVRDFGVQILQSEDHWWQYRDTDSLARALAEAGHLIVGYGMPWLAGELAPSAAAMSAEAMPAAAGPCAATRPKD